MSASRELQKRNPECDFNEIVKHLSLHHVVDKLLFQAQQESALNKFFRRHAVPCSPSLTCAAHPRLETIDATRSDTVNALKE